MPAEHDPEALEIKHLHQSANLDNLQVLEIGCGDGRLTWHYAGAARSVVATDPNLARLRLARLNCPAKFRAKVVLTQAVAQTLPFQANWFDRVLLTWSF